MYYQNEICAELADVSEKFFELYKRLINPKHYARLTEKDRETLSQIREAAVFGQTNLIRVMARIMDHEDYEPKDE